MKAFLLSTGMLLPTLKPLPAFSQEGGNKTPPIFRDSRTDSFKIRGNVSATGLIQTGNETRTVASLLSVITMGGKYYEIEPLTSIAYSTKPGKRVEGEYLENVIVRLRQEHEFYPAIGLSGEKSFLRVPADRARR